MRPNTVTRAWTTLAAHAGLKIIRLHDARHSHASLMLKQGIHPKIVQERLGHSHYSDYPGYLLARAARTSGSGSQTF
ncbi:MAG TPA: tyrosine-type recombinase/integrase [Dehalococcoidia bacterium]|nr:tyrosine-type recombinase/integrase [Dehalococcoidia bacterium]